jgi:hypothetical protein
LGNLSTPNSVQKLQTALHAKAKAEPGYRFYALYDKIGREDILAHAYAQCRSNKGAPGVDRQDFEAVEAYGVERWLGELALALRQETYRPDPIRRVYIPKANGKLRPLGICLMVVFVFLSLRLSSSPGLRLRSCSCAERQERKSCPGSSAVQFERQHSLPREANPGRSSR